MKDINDKLCNLGNKCQSESPITVAIVGLGSVGCFLLNFILSSQLRRLRIVVAARHGDSLQKRANLARVSALLRGELRCEVEACELDLSSVEQIASFLHDFEPDFVFNTSRRYVGLKYGSVSWPRIRMYGLWTPLELGFNRNIMHACEAASLSPIIVNASHSDIHNPLLKERGVGSPDFGAGNFNHLIPRIKFVVARKFPGISLEDIDVTLCTGHFHDVLISKEGRFDGVEPLLRVLVDGKVVEFREEDYLACAIGMPTDHTRNMMSASSNFDILAKILRSVQTGSAEKLHCPGVLGEIGGYPVIVDTKRSESKLRIDTEHFSIEEMRQHNIQSMKMDGVESVAYGDLTYTDELIERVRDKFQYELPKTVPFDEVDAFSDELIDHIIKPVDVSRGS